MVSNEEKARAYYIAAEWHDAQAGDDEQMLSHFKPKTTPHVNAATRAGFHRGAANGLRYAADQLRGQTSCA